MSYYWPKAIFTMNFHLISKNFDPSADDKDRKKLQQWLEEEPSRQTEVENLKKIWEESRKVKSFENIDPESDWLALKFKLSGTFKTRHKKIPVYAYAIRIAAVVLISFCLTFGLVKIFRTAGSETATFVTYESLGAVKSLILPDGSTVALNVNSSVKYKIDFNREAREVILAGEAYFEVNPDHSRPFRVYTGNSIVEVTGTNFSIFEDSACIRVGVLSGSVYLQSAENPAIGALVAQNESGLIYKDNTLEKQTQLSTNIISWKTGQLKFHKAPIGSALQDIAHHFHKELLFETTFADSLTAQFTNQPLEEILNELSLLTSLSITQTDNIIVVKQ
jgi:transmembrane sensor